MRVLQARKVQLVDIRVSGDCGELPVEIEGHADRHCDGQVARYKVADVSPRSRPQSGRDRRPVRKRDQIAKRIGEEPARLRNFRPTSDVLAVSIATVQAKPVRVAVVGVASSGGSGGEVGWTILHTS